MNTRIFINSVTLVVLLAALLGSAAPRQASAAGEAYPLDPTSFTSLGASSFTSGTYTINASMDDAAPTLSGPGITTPIAGVFYSPSNGATANDEIAVFTFSSLTIPAGVTVKGAQNANSRPIALLSQSTVTIDGTIDVSGANGTDGADALEPNVPIGGNGGNAGPGGGGGGGGSSLGGNEGSGGLGFVNGASGLSYLDTGGSVEPGGGGLNGGWDIPGAGGAFGGNGDDPLSSDTRGSTAYGDLSLRLQGGSGGGGGGRAFVPGSVPPCLPEDPVCDEPEPDYLASGGGGGGGGGAVEIGAIGNISLGGSVLANGGGGGIMGGSSVSSSGGGAGGGILVHAPMVSLSGNLNAIGGNASGGGGGGRVLILTADGTLASGSLAANVNVSGGLGAGGTGVAELEQLPEPADITPPVITASGTKADGTPYTPGTWTNQNVTVHFTCSDAGSGVATCPGDQVISPDGTFTAVGTAHDNAGNTATASFGPIRIDKTAPTITASGTKADGTPYTLDTWTNQNITVHFTCADATSGVLFCSGDQVISPDGTFTAHGTVRDNANNSGGTDYGPLKIDKTAPTTSGSASVNGTQATVTLSASDALSGVASTSYRVDGGAAQSYSGPFTVTGTGAHTVTFFSVDVAANTESERSTSFDISAPTPTATNTPTNTPASTPTPTATDTPTNTPTPTATNTPTNTPASTPTPTATNTPTPSNTPTATSTPPSFPITGVLDNFNRANGKVGSNWEGLTDTSFYKIAGNKLDVQSGGPLVWKPSSFGTTQEAFVTLSTIDTKSISQGLLLKVQTGNNPNNGAISVVYDARFKAVRVSALRLGQNGAWTLYANQPATFANGDVLGARVAADGTVKIYKNGTLIATVTLNAADQAFFNSKGGRIGLWTVGASNAIFDDFGGGTAMP